MRGVRPEAGTAVSWCRSFHAARRCRQEARCNRGALTGVVADVMRGVEVQTVEAGALGIGVAPEDTRTRSRLDARLIVALGTVWLVWGSTFAGMRAAVATIPPFAMASSRFLLAGALLYGVCVLRGKARFGRDDLVSDHHRRDAAVSVQRDDGLDGAVHADQRQLAAALARADLDGRVRVLLGRRAAARDHRRRDADRHGRFGVAARAAVRRADPALPGGGLRPGGGFMGIRLGRAAPAWQARQFRAGDVAADADRRRADRHRGGLSG